MPQPTWKDDDVTPTPHEPNPEPAVADADAVPGEPQRRGFLAMFIAYWFGINLVLGTTIGASIPKFFAYFDDASKGTNLSITAGVGGIVVMLITPLFGRLSDRSMSRLGKRRPWILGGAVAGLLGSGCSPGRVRWGRWSSAGRSCRPVSAPPMLRCTPCWPTRSRNGSAPGWPRPPVPAVDWR